MQDRTSSMEIIYDFAVVGGGIIGVSAAYNLQTSYPKLKILLLEKETNFGAHQTGHNSGVIHSGLYYKPGSKKADFCVRGRKRLLEFAREHKIDHEVCGKVVIATEKSELPFLNNILENGVANNLQGIEEITAEQVKEIEPFVECIAGISVPSTGIINFVAVTTKMVEIIKCLNSESSLLVSQEVKSIYFDSGVSNLVTNNKRFKARKVIFCGGLQADRLARMDKIQLKERIVGFRGDYYELAEHAKCKVKNLIYPVPNPNFPFLGVHFTRMIDGGVECGPNAVLTFKREGYKKTDFNFYDTFDALTYSGTWKLLASNFGFAVKEYRRAFSKRLFLETLQRMIPSLTMDDIVPGRAGVRAQYLGLDGDTREDFKIEYSENSIHVLNAPSPAATASLAIGEEIKIIAEKRFNLY
jgi:L-2-hydroxyglutarate oxidase